MEEMLNPSNLKKAYSFIEQNKDKLKVDLGSQAGIDEVSDDDIKGAQSILKGSGVVASQGIDPRQVSPSDLKLADPDEDYLSQFKKYSAELDQDEAQKEEKASREQRVALALINTLPTLFGYAIGGSEGGAIGAGAGISASKGLMEESKDAAKLSREEKKEKKKGALELFQEKEKGSAALKKSELEAKQGKEKTILEKDLDLRNKIIEAQLKKKIEGSGLTGEKADTALKLGKDYENNKITQNTILMAGFNSNIQDKVLSQAEKLKAGRLANPQDDLDLVFSYAKMLDPTSVVREGDVIIIKNRQGLDNKIISTIDQVNEGTILAPDSRRFLAESAQRKFDNQAKQQATFQGQFSERVKKFGIDPSLVVQDFGVNLQAPQGQQVAAPKDSQVPTVSKSVAANAPALKDASTEDLIARRKALFDILNSQDVAR